MNTWMKLKILTLQCLCTNWLNIVIIHLEVYGSLKMTNHLYLMYLYLNPDNVATDNSSSSFEPKSSIFGKPTADGTLK